MTETIDLIASRFACRAFTGAPVPRETLRTIAEAGLHAPSAVNRQPWRLIILDDKAELDQLGAVGLENLKDSDPAGYERILGRGGYLLYQAPAMIVIAREKDATEYTDLDVGLMASHLVLAAASLGVNSCVAALPGQAFAGEGGAERAKAIGMPDGFEFALAVLLGYAAKEFTPHAIDPSKIIER